MDRARAILTGPLIIRAAAREILLIFDLRRGEDLPVFVMSRNLDELVPLSMDPTRVFSGLERMEDRTKSSMRTLHSYLADDDDAILILFNY